MFVVCPFPPGENWGTHRSRSTCTPKQTSLWLWFQANTWIGPKWLAMNLPWRNRWQKEKKMKTIQQLDQSWSEHSCVFILFLVWVTPKQGSDTTVINSVHTIFFLDKEGWYPPQSLLRDSILKDDKYYIKTTHLLLHSKLHGKHNSTFSAAKTENQIYSLKVTPGLSPCLHFGNL